ncbi:MAG: tetratricopeptide repeat protein [bacterium]
MKKVVIFILTAILFYLALSGCEKKPSEQQIFDEAKKYQESQDFENAVTQYAKLIELHPKGKYAPQSQFMIGFIYANELKNYEEAKQAYTAFLEKYSSTADSGMVASARWELEHLGQDINEIEELSTITESQESSEEPAPEAEKDSP